MIWLVIGAVAFIWAVLIVMRDERERKTMERKAAELFDEWEEEK